jgi:glycosyltransferase involved in cell wall biosynthesis
MPKVSIIIPCYNQSQYLNDCLESVINQTYQNWECLIINDGSIDDTQRISLLWQMKDNRFRYFYKNNGGLSSARNYGIEKADGDFIQFLDCDDLIEPCKIENDLDFLVKNPSIDLVYSSAKFFFNNNYILSYYSREKDGLDWTLESVSPNFNYVNSISNWNIMVVSSPFIRKTLCEKVGFFDVSLQSLEDWDYWIRCILQGGQFYYRSAIQNTLTLIRCYAGSMSTNMDLMWENELKLRHKYKNTKIHNAERYNTVKNHLFLKLNKKSRSSRKIAFKILFKNIKFLSSLEVISLIREILLRK